MVSKEQVEQVVLKSGLWDGEQSRSHSFILSPSVYQISQRQVEELGELGSALYDCMSGLARVACIAFTPNLWKSEAWRQVARALWVGVPKVYRDVQMVKPSRVPHLCKVDMLESARDGFKIVEIDAHNKHGLGYSTLGARLRRSIAPDAASLPGVASVIADEVARRRESSIVMLLADQERFYLPESRILQDELQQLGVKLVLVNESEIEVDGAHWLKPGENPLDSFLWMDFPFLFHNQELNLALEERYRKGELDFLIPPKPFLGSKAVLALLGNQEQDQELEAILCSQIRPESLAVVRRYLPRTYLVHRGRGHRHWEALCNGGNFVIKETVSSGMKGVAFSDEARFEQALRLACRSDFKFILQEEVENASQTLEHFTPEGKTEEGSWNLRVTAHFMRRGTADVMVTARRDKWVHGAKDCLQIGTIIS